MERGKEQGKDGTQVRERIPDYAQATLSRCDHNRA